MALSIKPTPVLKGRDARRFEDDLKKDLKNSVYLKPTPKIEEARNFVRGYVKGKHETIKEREAKRTNMKTIEKGLNWFCEQCFDALGKDYEITSYPNWFKNACIICNRTAKYWVSIDEKIIIKENEKG